MKQGIIITTHISTLPFLNDLLVSLKDCKFPVVVKMNNDYDNGFELAGISLGMQLFDEFLFLQDTILLKDISFLGEVFHPKYKNISITLFPEFNAYMGKYVSSILRNIGVQKVNNKRDAVRYERIFTREYLKNSDSVQTLFPEIDAWKPSNRFEFKHGRLNCIYENDYMIKFKGTWKESMIK